MKPTISQPPDMHASLDRRPPKRSGIGRALSGTATMGLWPVWTMRRCEGTPLWAAWLAHVLAIILAVGVAIVGFAFVETIDAQTVDLAQILYHAMYGLAKVPGEILREIVSTHDAPLLLLTYAAVLEAIFVLVAVPLVPWSARDESLRQTRNHVLKVAWLSTGAIVPLLAFFFAITLALEWYEATHGTPMPTLGDVNAFMKWHNARPWLIRHEAEILGLTTLAAFGWYVSVVLRAGAVPRVGPPRARPPICEECGYNLSHTPVESRCPECGTIVRESMSPGLRRPNAWELGRGLRPIGALVRCGFAAAFTPGQFFRSMQTRHGLARAKAFFLVCFVAGLAITPLIGLWIGMWEGAIGDYLLDDLPGIIVVCLVLAMLPLAWVLGLAALTGAYYRSTWRQNAMSGVAKVFFYEQGLFLMIWTLCGLAWGPILLLADLVGDQGWQVGDLDAELIIVVGTLAVDAVFLLIHLSVCMSGVRKIRYANS